MVFNQGILLYLWNGEKTNMTADTLTRFRNELNSFFVLVIMNIVLGALAIAFGVQFMVTSVQGFTPEPSLLLFRILAGSLAMVSSGLGIAWIIFSVEIFEQVEKIRSEFSDPHGQVPDEVLTGSIVRMLSYYRENKKMIGTMVLVCTLGGFCFLALGILNIVQNFSAPDTLTRLLSVSAAAINLTIGIVSLMFCRYFRNYSAAWDRRLEEADRSEYALKHAMEQQ
jgi:hypothetical protein